VQATKALEMKNFIVVLAFILFPLNSEGATPSYRCTTQETGGFNHTKEGHKLGRFRANDFRIVPFSNLPDEAVYDVLVGEAVGKDNFGLGYPLPSDVAVLKEAYTARMERISGKRGHIESISGLSFLRSTKDDPNDGNSYTMCNQIIFWKTEFDKSDKSLFDIDRISCDRGDTQFRFENGRFTQSNFGSWHSDPRSMPDYYGDSSSFSFGTCELYYD
jgi:hypothetical protein